MTVLNGGQVNGTYTLTIDDGATNNTGTLTAWSVTDSAELPTFGPQAGAPMDQNADGTADQNALTVPFTGLTPGDVYAVPAPQPTAPVTFFGVGVDPRSPVQSEHPAADRAGPADRRQLGARRHRHDNLVTDGTVSSMNVTFDRPMQVSTFTPAQVLGIMGPTGSITGPQTFPSDGIDQAIPAATATGSGSLDSTLTVPSSDGTFKVQGITVADQRRLPDGSALTAALDGAGRDADPPVLGRGRQRRQLRQHDVLRHGGDLDRPGDRPVHRDLPAQLRAHPP